MTKSAKAPVAGWRLILTVIFGGIIGLLYLSHSGAFCASMESCRPPLYVQFPSLFGFLAVAALIGLIGRGRGIILALISFWIFAFAAAFLLL